MGNKEKNGLPSKKIYIYVVLQYLCINTLNKYLKKARLGINLVYHTTQEY